MENNLISRQAAIESLHMHLMYRMGTDSNKKRLDEWINNLPSAQPERKTGKWKGYNADNPKWQRTDGTPIFLVCSECDGSVLNNGSAHWNFCPNCGADMRGEQNGQ